MVTTGMRAQNIQYAAMPWRKTGGGLEILLITTRNTRRWIIPKGWPITHCTPSECAAYEAVEEAGVVGTMATQTLGTFRYGKRRKSGEIVRCIVHVFAMEVTSQRRRWPERHARDSAWLSPGEACARVSERGLSRLIAKFARLLDPQ